MSHFNNTGQQKTLFVLNENMTKLFYITFGCWFQIWHSFSCGTSNFGATAKGFFGYINSCVLIY